MLRIGTLIFLAVFLAAAVPIPNLKPSYVPPPSRGDAQTEHQKYAQEKGHNGDDNERGTAKAPLIIQIQQPESQQEVATETEEQGGWYANPDWWVAAFTGALFIVTAGLWIFTALLWDSTRKDFRAAHRPRLEVSRVRLADFGAGQTIRAKFVVSNTGTGTGQCIGGFAKLDRLPEKMPVPFYANRTDDIQVRRYMPGATDEFTASSSWTDNGDCGHSDGTSLYLIGYLVCKDSIGTITTYFCRRHDPESMSFSAVENSDWERIA